MCSGIVDRTGRAYSILDTPLLRDTAPCPPFKLHINIKSTLLKALKRSPIRLFEPFEPLFFLGRVSACGETGVTPCRNPHKNPHPASRMRP